MGMMDGPARPVCPRCQEPLLDQKLVAMCLKCVGRIYLAELRRQEREALQAKPKLVLMVAPVGNIRHTRARHIVFSVDTRFTYCGQRPSGPKKKWELWHMVRDQDVCEECLKLREQFLAAAESALGANS
jgi:hypothetical protein